jgi:hypothetical protein
MIVADLIGKLSDVFDRSFDVVSDIRSNDILLVFGGYVKVFAFVDEI